MKVWNQRMSNTTTRKKQIYQIRNVRTMERKKKMKNMVLKMKESAILSLTIRYTNYLRRALEMT